MKCMMLLLAYMSMENKLFMRLYMATDDDF